MKNSLSPLRRRLAARSCRPNSRVRTCTTGTGPAQCSRLWTASGHLPTDYPYPLEIWQFGQDLTLIALGGEVVVDYDLRLKRELGAEKLWVAAYCNDVFAYIPSLRVLMEGGYEGGGAMVYYGQPGPFAPTIEETIIGKVHDLVRQVRG